MAVLVEATSVIVRRDAIVRSFAGGWAGFLATVPNETLCWDDDVARVGFMKSTDASAYLATLQQGGLTYYDGEKAVEMVVIEQGGAGPTLPCDWIEFAQLPLGPARELVGAAWLFEGERRFGPGIYLSTRDFRFATPMGWDYRRSLTRNGIRVPDAELNDRFFPLGRRNGVDVHLDLKTGREMFTGRTEPEGEG